MTRGDAWEVFRQQAPNHQENDLWACYTIAAEAQDPIEAHQARPSDLRLWPTLKNGCRLFRLLSRHHGEFFRTGLREYPNPFSDERQRRKSR